MSDWFGDLQAAWVRDTPEQQEDEAGGAAAWEVRVHEAQRPAAPEGPDGGWVEVDPLVDTTIYPQSSGFQRYTQQQRPQEHQQQRQRQQQQRQRQAPTQRQTGVQQVEEDEEEAASGPPVDEACAEGRVVFVQFGGGPGLDEDDLTAIVRQFGRVKECRVVTNDQGAHKQCAFVEMDRKQDAWRAIDKLDSIVQHGHRLRLLPLPSEPQPSMGQTSMEKRFVADINRTVRFRQHLNVLAQHQRDKERRERKKQERARRADVQRQLDQFRRIHERAWQKLESLAEDGPFTGRTNCTTLNAQLTDQLREHLPALETARLDSRTGEVLMGFSGEGPPPRQGAQTVQVHLTLDVDLPGAQAGSEAAH